MRAVIVTYRLRSGARGRLQCLVPSTSDGVLLALAAFGHDLRSASARCHEQP